MSNNLYSTLTSNSDTLLVLSNLVSNNVGEKVSYKDLGLVVQKLVLRLENLSRELEHLKLEQNTTQKVNVREFDRIEKSFSKQVSQEGTYSLLFDVAKIVGIDTTKVHQTWKTGGNMFAPVYMLEADSWSDIITGKKSNVGERFIRKTKLTGTYRRIVTNDDHSPGASPKKIINVEVHTGIEGLYVTVVHGVTIGAFSGSVLKCERYILTQMGQPPSPFKMKLGTSATGLIAGGVIYDPTNVLTTLRFHDDTYGYRNPVAVVHAVEAVDVSGKIINGDPDTFVRYKVTFYLYPDDDNDWETCETVSVNPTRQHDPETWTWTDHADFRHIFNKGDDGGWIPPFDVILTSPTTLGTRVEATDANSGVVVPVTSIDSTSWDTAVSDLSAQLLAITTEDDMRKLLHSMRQVADEYEEDVLRFSRTGSAGLFDALAVSFSSSAVIPALAVVGKLMVDFAISEYGGEVYTHVLDAMESAAAVAVRTAFHHLREFDIDAASATQVLAVGGYFVRILQQLDSSMANLASSHPKDVEHTIARQEYYMRPLSNTLVNLQTNLAKQVWSKLLPRNRVFAHGMLVQYFPFWDGQTLKRKVLILSVGNYEGSFGVIEFLRGVPEGGIGSIIYDQTFDEVTKTWSNMEGMHDDLTHAWVDTKQPLIYDLPFCQAFIKLMKKHSDDYNLLTNNCHDKATLLMKFGATGEIPNEFHVDMNQIFASVHDDPEYTPTADKAYLKALVRM